MNMQWDIHAVHDMQKYMRKTAVVLENHKSRGTLPHMRCIFGLLLASVATGETYRVPQDCQTIQAAIDEASSGDEIIVSSGIWKEQIDISGKTLLIRSESGAEQTVIDAGHRGSVVTCTSEQTVMAGFEIRGGKATKGGGIYAVDSSPTLRLCWIEFNEASQGGGVYARNANPVFEQCVFSCNDAEDGDGIWAKHARPVLTACIFAGDSIGWERGEMVTIRDTNSPAGACCIRDVCVQTASVACWEAGGLYRGENSTCVEACDPVCDEDVTGDGVVNMTDLLRVVWAFGFCP